MSSSKESAVGAAEMSRTSEGIGCSILLEVLAVVSRVGKKEDY